MVEITDEIVELANRAWHEGDGNWPDWLRAALTAVAPLIAAQEREACAKVADVRSDGHAEDAAITLSTQRPDGALLFRYQMRLDESRDCAAAIRARGEAP
jgi:kynureninase